jgi:hypothetical protein
MVGAEHLQERERLVSRVLHVVAHGEGDVADVAGLVVERAGLAGGGEHGHPSLARQVVLPFVGVRVPVQLAQASRLDLHQRRGDSLRDGEVA